VRYLEEKLIYTNEKGLSVEISHSSLFILQKVDGLAAIKNIIYTSKGVNQDGVTPTGQSLDKRDISIEGSINSMEQEEVLKHRQELIKVFNPKLTGILRYEFGDFIKEIDCKIEIAPTLPYTDSTFKNFLIQLVCPNPYWKDILESKEEIALWKGDFEFDLEITDDGIEMEHREPSLIVNVLNDGDVECGMRVEFKALATVVNPSILNVNTQEYIKINKSMVAGEVISVSTYFGNKKVESILNGVTTNAFNYIDFNSIFLQLGTGDNLMRYDADTGLDNLEVSIYYQPKYLGV
jgi:hypothetical protein